MFGIFKTKPKKVDSIKVVEECPMTTNILTKEYLDSINQVCPSCSQDIWCPIDFKNFKKKTDK